MSDARRARQWVLAVAWLATGLTPAQGKPDGVLDIGYSTQTFTEVDVNDALAATQVWVSRFMHSIGRLEGARTQVFDTVDEALSGVRTEQLDLLVLLPTEYLDLRAQVHLVPLLTSAQGILGARFGILGRSGAEDVARMRDGRMLVAAGSSGNIPEMWLETVLAESSLPPAADHFREVSRVDRVTRAVLPVFFGQASGCVVNLNGYQTMVELNPQLGRELAVLHTSMPMPQAVICARPEINEAFGEILVEGMRSLHEDPEGRQVLSLFGIERLVHFQDEHLDAVRALRAQAVARVMP